MEKIFLKLLEMTISGSICIIIVLITRVFLRKCPKIFSYLLWSIVLVRLICPFSFQSQNFGIPVSNYSTTIQMVTYDTIISNLNRGILKNKLGNQNLSTDLETEGTALNDDGNNYLNDTYLESNEKTTANDSSLLVSARVRLDHTWVSVANLLWIVGILTLSCCSVVKSVRLKRLLKHAVKIEEQLYESDHISTAFLFGLLHPVIYLPTVIDEPDRIYILAHERVHLKRKDYLIKLIFYFALILHWYNPLVWFAYRCMCKDMEMSCDEWVIRNLGLTEKKEYSNALLNLSVGHVASLTGPLAFGENDIKARVKNVLFYKKPVFWGIFVVIMVLILTSGGLLTNRVKQEAITTDMEAVTPEKNTIQYSEEETKKNQDVVEISKTEDLRNMNRGENLTWNNLEQLVTLNAPNLEDYAGYNNALWPSITKRSEGVLTDSFSYELTDEETGELYYLTITYYIQDNRLWRVNLMKLFTRENITIYAEEGQNAQYVDTDIAGFLSKKTSLDDWLTVSIPKEKEIQIGGYRADIGIEGGILFSAKQEETSSGGEYLNEWNAAGGILRVNTEEVFTYEEGVLTDARLMYNHSELVESAKILEGYNEQAVTFLMNHDLYTVPEIYEREEAGNPVPESETTSTIRYIAFARKGSTYGYFIYFNERYFSKEEALEIAKSVKFKDAAW